MNNNDTFADKVVLVTGGTSGIGKETAIEFARAGAKGGIVDQISAIVPAGRSGTGEEIAAAVFYLFSDAAKFITGTSLVVDGGIIAK